MRTIAMMMVIAFLPHLSGQNGTAVSAALSGDNSILTAMYEDDQRARNGNHVDWTKLSKDDEQRRGDLKTMLAVGSVKTGNDYFHAAMIFQHGLTPDDYLLAHVLSMDAVALGSREGQWLSAATLDRYLLSIWQPQVFGTQFHGALGFSPITHDKLNSAIVTDSMRAATCVVANERQEELLANANRGGGLASTQLEEEQCRNPHQQSNLHK